MHTSERKKICEIQKSQKKRRRKNALCKECRNPTKNYEKPHVCYICTEDTWCSRNCTQLTSSTFELKLCSYSGTSWKSGEPNALLFVNKNFQSTSSQLHPLLLLHLHRLCRQDHRQMWALEHQQLKRRPSVTLSCCIITQKKGGMGWERDV